MALETLHIRRTSTADKVANVLRVRILAGELRPGTTLLEIPFSRQLGVSRNTMREAMRILSLEGLLKRKIHHGVTVAELSLADVEEIYRLRRMLEIQAVRLAGRARADDFTAMTAALEEFEIAASSADWVKAVEADMRFHRRLVRLHRSARLQGFYNKVLAELRLGMVLVDRAHDDPRRLIPQHQAMLEMLTTKQTEECVAVLSQHLDDSERRLRSIFAEPAALQAPTEAAEAFA